jgi:large subunit ribosomal protein L10
MNRAGKEAFVEEFRERVRSAPVLYLTDYSGLDVQSMTRLRQLLRAVGAELMVVKNRLVMRALSDLDKDFPDLGEHLTGPTGIVVGSDEPVGPAKALSDFAKANQSRPVFKIGVVDEKLVDAGQFQQLAKLPPRIELLAMLAGSLEAPLEAVVAVLQGKLQEAAGVLESLRQERESVNE